MLLTYMEVHLYYTLPMLGVLSWLSKPYYTSTDSLKFKFLSLVAFTTASVWDNYIVYHKAWSYCPTCVTAVIGYVPLEEYMFFIIMTLLTVSFTNLVMRWHLHSFFIKPETPVLQSMLVRFVPITALLITAYKAWHLAVPGKPLFYGSCILWYACPVLALLWFGAGEYMLRRPLAVLISIALPTLFLCWVDVVAIGAGTWDISLATSTGKFVVPHLPVEEFMFFALINTVLVFGTCAIDRTMAILHLFTKKSPYQRQYQHDKSFLHQILEMTWAFCLPDQVLNTETFHDLSVSWDILRKASKSFYTASAVFPGDVRQELGVLYAFCRATDDLCDNEQVPVQKRKDQLTLTHRFVSDLFSQKSSAPSAIDWEFYNDQLPASCISAFKSFTRLRHVLEAEAIKELLDGYKWDLEHRSIMNQEDLSYYSACVASSVGEMCTRIILAHADKPTSRKETQWIIQRAREMGLVLQYTNIARDIVTDSKELGRCYLPQAWLTDKEVGLIQDGRARDIGEETLLLLSHRLINQADELMVSANKGIDKLPSHCQGGVRAACNVYASIGARLKSYRHHYPSRAHVGHWKRVQIALLSVYNLYTAPIETKQGRQGKMRNLNTI
ncbi:uncharacterized protein ATC70_005492 [Mucor velutinosus]|uniref:Bifunctional lycopene cyclase/phytoene synthase n=1 Tax=Mucor velutinosus TaxID=708070 RepID=A0AAN7DEW3_9FUNG|nr:hypothetical protein ATC70_005492 [Mucor velutinosus]